MTPTSVGMRCPECAGDRTEVRTARSMRSGRMQATYALMGKGGYADLAKKIEVVRKRDKKYLV